MDLFNIGKILFDDKCCHVNRECRIYAKCCDDFFNCRHCHDELKYHRENNYNNRHLLDYMNIEKIQCKECETIQKKQQYCESCGICFGKYYCEKCCIFENMIDVFHCDKCGNCRKGKKEDFRHCDKCNVCLLLNHFEEGKCMENITEEECSVCCEKISIGVNGFMSLKCGHVLHQECYINCVKSGNDKCPLCCKTMYENESKKMYLKLLVNATKMPEEYSDKYVSIYCNDCGEKSDVKWHIVAMFCEKCDSFNTKQI